MPAVDRYIGLMSGTSLDGVDGVLLAFDGTSQRIEAFQSAPFTPSLRAELLALNSPGPNELHRAALAGNALAQLYAVIVERLLQAAGCRPESIRAIGAHGQTVRHCPGDFDGVGYTWQINQPALLAELTGIRVVADFRSRDVAAGGQGAPLVPAYHQAVFAQAQQVVALVNIGGISNISVLAPLGLDGGSSAPPRGFDCGPGNVLLDSWCQLHTGQPYDALGAWGETGRVVSALLARCLDEPFFQRQPPKSTGRDLFHLDWLMHKRAGFEHLPPQDIQATLVALTCHAIARAVHDHADGVAQVLVCGGGAFNTSLMRQLQAALPGIDVTTTANQGIDPQQVEACAFAWLARQHCQALPGNIPGVTGARGLRVLGVSSP